MLNELFVKRSDLDFVVFCTPFNRELLAADGANVKLVTLAPARYYEEVALLSRRFEIDVLFRSFPTAETLDFPLRRQVFLIPDLQHEEFPGFFDPGTLSERKRAFGTAFGGAGGIVTISEHARRAIDQHVAESCDVFVASPALPQDFMSARSDAVTDEERASVPDGEFFYFPANLWPHKNHERLFQALRLFNTRAGTTVRLVLTGSPRGWEELRERYSDLPIVHLGYVRPPLVRLLYERALALVFFSLYEGFGIPLLEAFASGTPVVCGNTTSLPEVYGDAALSCDPLDVVAIAGCLAEIAADPDLRAQLAARGRARVGSYTWERAAAQLGAGLNRLLRRVSPSMEERPLVSVVTPSFNQGRFIRQTIDSVLAQTYTNVEYVVIDGGSTDETVDILKSYGSRIEWISEADAGQTSAINKGLRRVRGEIVGYLNSDDVLLPHAIETIVNHLHGHPACDLVYGDADYIDEEGLRIGSYPTADYSFSRLMEDCCICQPAAWWRSNLVAAVGPFDESREYAMDYEYWIRADRSGFVLQHLPVVLAQSRLHPETKTLSARRAIYQEIFDVCRSQGGYISRGYVQGYWEHLSHDGSGLVRLLTRSRLLRRPVEAVHFRLVNGHLSVWRNWILTPLLILRRVLMKNPRVLALLVTGASRLRNPGASARVEGYWTDNRVGERLTVRLDARALSRRVHVVGRPVEDMAVEVSIDSNVVTRCELSTATVERIEIDVPAGPPQVLTMAFAGSRRDGYGRSVSFILEETSLFGEADIPSAAHLTETLGAIEGLVEPANRRGCRRACR